jgi:hypothetical protein
MIPRSCLDRWNVYAKSVQKLTIDGSHYHSETFLELARVSEQPILPSLKAVVAYGPWLARTSAPSILATVLSQSVHNLEIMLPSKGEARKILETIHLHAPRLRYLILRGPHSPPVRNIVCMLLPSFLSLQVLRLDSSYANTDFLTAISPSLSGLWMLDFRFWRYRRDHCDSVLPAKQAIRPNREIGAKLPSLTSLLLQCKAANCCHLGDIIGKTFGRNHQLRLLSITHNKFTCYNGGQVGECISRYCEAFSIAFPHLETLCLDSKDNYIMPLKIEAVKPLTQFTQLSQLSLIGLKVTDISEFTRFLACWPNLVKLEIIGSRLTSLWFADGYDGEFAYRCIDNDVAEGKLEGVEGIGLSCLTAISARLLHLKTLRLTLVASPSGHLEQAPQPFKNLETLDLTHSFLNFHLLDFNHEKAAQFINSVMDSRTGFIFREDESLVDDLRDGGELDTFENMAWVEYSREYNQFCKQFREKVDLSYHARLDERKRLA